MLDYSFLPRPCLDGRELQATFQDSSAAAAAAATSVSGSVGTPDPPFRQIQANVTRQNLSSSSLLAMFPSSSFKPYPLPTPDPAIHGSEPLVAALPAQPRLNNPPDASENAAIFPMWHLDAGKVGALYDNNSVFVKLRKDGSISLIYEQQLRQRNAHGYAFTIVSGRISPSDGIGFVFANRVPCSKNIKKIWSIFVNRGGLIIKRMGPELVLAPSGFSLPPLQTGMTIAIAVDLNQYRATFEARRSHAVLDPTTDPYPSQCVARVHIDLSDMAEKVDCSQGYLCAAIAKAGMVVQVNQHPTSILDEPAVHQTNPQSQQPLHNKSSRRRPPTGGGGARWSKQPQAIPPPPPPIIVGNASWTVDCLSPSGPRLPQSKAKPGLGIQMGGLRPVESWEGSHSTPDPFYPPYSQWQKKEEYISQVFPQEALIQDTTPPPPNLDFGSWFSALKAEQREETSPTSSTTQMLARLVQKEDIKSDNNETRSGFDDDAAAAFLLLPPIPLDEAARNLSITSNSSLNVGQSPYPSAHRRTLLIDPVLDSNGYEGELVERRTLSEKPGRNCDHLEEEEDEERYFSEDTTTTTTCRKQTTKTDDESSLLSIYTWSDFSNDFLKEKNRTCSAPPKAPPF